MKDNSKSSKLIKRIEEFAQVLQNNVYLRAISKGMMQTIPILILGSIVTLLRAIPFAWWTTLIATPAMSTVLNALAMFTNGALAIWVLLAVSNRMGHYFKQDVFATSMVSLLAFFIITPVVTLEQGRFINTGWIGTRGVFTAMILGVLVSRLYIFLMEKEIYIKMPETVPTFVERAFANIVPLLIISLVSGAVLGLFLGTSFGSFPNLIYTILQIPLQRLGGSYVGVSLAFMAMSLLWWMGIHGKMIVYGAAFGSIFTVNSIENAEAVLSSGVGIHTFDIGFVRVFFEHGGAGSILALVFLMAFFAKSQQFKSMGKLISIPTFFGISEPAIFGIPIVLNFKFLIPVLLAPFVSGTIGYILIQTGILQVSRGIMVPTGTPYILDAWLIGGLPYVIAQIVALAAAIAVYLPFFISADKEAYESEQQALKEGRLQRD